MKVKKRNIIKAFSFFPSSMLSHGAQSNLKFSHKFGIKMQPGTLKSPLGSVVCPRCEDVCDSCNSTVKSTATDPVKLLENLDDDACFGETVSNGLMGFLRNFGLSLGGA
jgi:hypothetical protein